MKNIIKKICICGASLMMVSSLGVGINNVSAKRVHRHARTHRITTNNHYLFNQGRNDGKRYGRNFNIMLPETSSKYSDSTYNNIMLHLIENHYNHSYQHGFRAGMNDAVGGHQPSVIQNIGFLTRRAKRLANHHHLNSHNVYAYFHKDTRPKYTKRNKLHAKRGHKSSNQYYKTQYNYKKSNLNKLAFKRKMINEYKRHNTMFENGMDDVVFGMLDGGVNSYSVIHYNHMNNKYYKDGWIASLSIASNYKDQMDFDVNPFIHNLNKSNSLKNLAKAKKAWNETVRAAKKSRDRYNNDKYISIPALKLEHYSNSAIKRIAKTTNMTGSDF